ncbi:hypothetical protein [Tissierella sp.]|uniref:hypothetical protein n=1 Tax=Tissierella sp. TaxID=41274 RepID=UPI0030433CB5
MNYLIPNIIVRGGSDTITLINEMLINKVIADNDCDKVLLIFKYLWTNTTQSNTVNFTLEDMIIDCGFVPRTNKDGINDKFKNVLNYLNNNNYFEPNDYDFMSIKPKEFIKVGVQYFSTDDKGNRIKYFMLSDEEIDEIYSIDGVDNKKLLLYYSSLKSRIYNSFSVEDTKAQVCYSTVEEMARDILLATDTIDIYNNILVENGLIYKDDAGKFTKLDGSKRIFKQSANTYTLTSIPNYKEEVKESINSYKQYLKRFGWDLCKDTTLSKRQIAGSINKLKALQQQGKLSEEYKIKLEELQEQQNVVSDSRKWDNKQLLENHQGKLLSDIFLDKDMDKLAEKYQDIEYELGLIDDDLNLLVEWDYYKWIITEYNINEHDYYKNMVTKKIRVDEPSTVEVVAAEEDSIKKIDKDDEEYWNWDFDDSDNDNWGEPNPMLKNANVEVSETVNKEVEEWLGVKVEQDISYLEVELQNIEKILKYYHGKSDNMTKKEEEEAKSLYERYKKVKNELGA